MISDFPDASGTNALVFIQSVFSVFSFITDHRSSIGHSTSVIRLQKCSNRKYKVQYKAFHNSCSEENGVAELRSCIS